jgi:hypothetical protein
MPGPVDAVLMVLLAKLAEMSTLPRPPPSVMAAMAGRPR